MKTQMKCGIYNNAVFHRLLRLFYFFLIYFQFSTDIFTINITGQLIRTCNMTSFRFNVYAITYIKYEWQHDESPFGKYLIMVYSLHRSVFFYFLNIASKFY